MPQELISGQGPYNVRVGWQRDQDVQLGVEVPEGQLIDEMFVTDLAAMKQIGGAVLDFVRRYLVSTGELPEPADPAAIKALEQMGVFVSPPAPQDYGVDHQLGCIIIDKINEVRPYASVWATLDRAGANRLIQVVRRARDSSFGKDE